MTAATIILATVIVVATGCTPDPTGTPPAGHPARHVDVGRLPDQPFHDTHSRRADRPAVSRVDRTDPVAVAISHIAAGLVTEGLDVVDLGAEVTATADGRVTVRVAATLRTGPTGTPYTSVFELDLSLQPDGSWTMTDSRAVG